MSAKPMRGLRGLLIDAPQRGALRCVRDGAILVDEGCIAATGPFDEVRRSPEAQGARWLHSPESVIIPGLVDLQAPIAHYQAVARASLQGGKNFTRELAGLERDFNVASAREQAPAYLEALAKSGTTCAVIPATAHAGACEAVFEAAESFGLRVVAGLAPSLAGHPSAPTGGDKFLEHSLRLCREWHGRDADRLRYLFVQEPGDDGRAAEAAAEHKACLQLGEGGFDGKVLGSGPTACLMPERAAGERDFAEFGSGGPVTLVHTPTATLRSRLQPPNLSGLWEKNLLIGLGSDAGRGPELNLWRVMRSAIEAQIVRAAFDEKTRVPDEAELFHLATAGGAQALGTSSTTGTIEVGRDADLVVLDIAPLLPFGRKARIHSDLSAADIITLLVQRGSHEAVVETFVRGRPVFRAPAPLLS